MYYYQPPSCALITQYLDIAIRYEDRGNMKKAWQFFEMAVQADTGCILSIDV